MEKNCKSLGGNTTHQTLKINKTYTATFNCIHDY